MPLTHDAYACSCRAKAAHTLHAVATQAAAGPSPWCFVTAIRAHRPTTGAPEQIAPNTSSQLNLSHARQLFQHYVTAFA